VAGSTYAVLVGVEKYQQANIHGVSFAVADAEAMRDMLIRQMGVPPENIKLWTNEHATRSSLEHDLKYELDTLGPDDQFIFFYAGHGFYSNGSNRLTTWDTRTVNIEGTTVCLDQVLLSPLQNGHCRKSLVFIDACASSFGDPNTRNVLLDMQPEEFAAFVKTAEYRAAFFSCSPAQESYSSVKIQHGIWTYHLLQAFRGEDEAAFERDRSITGHSLQNFLARSVPEFITKKTDIKASQRPYAVMASNGAFEILRVPEKAIADEPQPPSEATPVVLMPDNAKVTAAMQVYIDQRKLLADTAVMTKIWGLPRWRLWSRPLEFRKARFQSLDHCEQFVATNVVRSTNSRWTMYPRFNVRPEHGFESIAAEFDFEEFGIEHSERWVLFQSGQFVHNAALDRVPQLGKRTHVLEILDVTTALFEFTGRMVDRKIVTDHVGIGVELHGVAGRQLAWREEFSLEGWCQEDNFGFDNAYTAEELRTGRRKLALDVALAVYAQFGWNDPPKEELATVQRQRFG
jgi:hypothetical protein